MIYRPDHRGLITTIQVRTPVPIPTPRNYVPGSQEALGHHRDPDSKSDSGQWRTTKISVQDGLSDPITHIEEAES